MEVICCLGSSTPSDAREIEGKKVWHSLNSNVENMVFETFLACGDMFEYWNKYCVKLTWRSWRCEWLLRPLDGVPLSLLALQLLVVLQDGLAQLNHPLPLLLSLQVTIVNNNMLPGLQGGCRSLFRLNSGLFCGHFLQWSRDKWIVVNAGFQSHIFRKWPILMPFHMVGSVLSRASALQTLKKFN